MGKNHNGLGPLLVTFPQRKILRNVNSRFKIGQKHPSVNKNLIRGFIEFIIAIYLFQKKATLDRMNVERFLAKLHSKHQVSLWSLHIINWDLILTAVCFVHIHRLTRVSETFISPLKWSSMYRRFRLQLIFLFCISYPSSLLNQQNRWPYFCETMSIELFI